MVDKLLNMALLGGEPILYLLIAVSFLSIAVAVERFITYSRNRFDLGNFQTKLARMLNTGHIEGAKEIAASVNSAEAAVVSEGLANFDKSRNVVSELMESAAVREQQRLDRRLIVLGTVGSNAPFVGLLGTVLGIIKAFNDLAFNTEGGPSVVMAGIAEALVATAIGLLVAIPAVIFFNYFKNRQKGIMSNISRLQKMLLAFVEDRETKDEPAPAKAA